MNPFAYKVAIVIPDMTNQYFSELSQLVQRFVTSANGIGVVFSSDGRQDVESRHLSSLTGFGFDGIVFVSVGDNLQVYEALVRMRLPHVVLDRELPENQWCDFVLSDNVEGAALAAQHLIKCGHEQVAYVAGDQRTEPGRARRDSFVAAYSSAGLSISDALLIDGDFSFRSGYTIGKQLTATTLSFSAVACGNDAMAIGVMQALQENGRRIPDDVSVVGYDDIPCASWVYPRLTTVRQELPEMARYAVELLISRIDEQNNTAPADRVVGRARLRAVTPRLVVRESCQRLQ